MRNETLNLYLYQIQSQEPNFLEENIFSDSWDKSKEFLTKLSDGFKNFKFEQLKNLIKRNDKEISSIDKEKFKKDVKLAGAMYFTEDDISSVFTIGARLFFTIYGYMKLDKTGIISAVFKNKETTAYLSVVFVAAVICYSVMNRKNPLSVAKHFASQVTEAYLTNKNNPIKGIIKVLTFLSVIFLIAGTTIAKDNKIDTVLMQTYKGLSLMGGVVLLSIMRDIFKAFSISLESGSSLDDILELEG